MILLPTLDITYPDIQVYLNRNEGINDADV